MPAAVRDHAPACTGRQTAAVVEQRKARAEALTKAIEAAGIPEFTIIEWTPLAVMTFVMIERFRAGDHQVTLVAARALPIRVHGPGDSPTDDQDFGAVKNLAHNLAHPTAESSRVFVRD